jgi:hypothetical protein
MRYLSVYGLTGNFYCSRLCGTYNLSGYQMGTRALLAKILIIILIVNYLSMVFQGLLNSVVLRFFLINLPPRQKSKVKIIV